MDNASAMVWGALAGDSLALGVHWIYDQAAIAARHGRISGLTDPPPGSYHPNRRAGQFTHYGDQTLLLLESVADCGGFDPADYSRRWRALFEGGYDGYLDRATKATLARLAEGWEPQDAGSASDDLAGASRIAPVVLALRADPEACVKACRAQTALTHNNAKVLDAAECFARTALACLEGTPPAEALVRSLEGRLPGSPLHAWMDAGLAAAGEDSVAAVARFGQSCHVDGAFQSVVQLIARHQDAPAEALADSAMAGGDSAARNLIVGMVLCAWKGLEALPPQWIEGLDARERIATALAKTA
ncbi:hypothetical protein NNJEOMEG_02479 [Fundidesulfovibrio magnetotacticus]|uniref:ADP-ribosylglycohydrolase n=1 Tax=Fundidesulfovibrio magnetotacticus TaxID=2730080 RepID=A0A6V8LPZ8_9BACT|nr:ADP-ribosylglycohydrolase family protein [Fundidesulfovibrio magnetotacticus]GFK94632.1 hypothetical protein NNJEOMEG_02479 [Fundidesulfovibrio magnetotacticus]